MTDLIFKRWLIKKRGTKDCEIWRFKVKVINIKIWYRRIITKVTLTKVPVNENW